MGLPGHAHYAVQLFSMGFAVWMIWSEMQFHIYMYASRVQVIFALAILKSM